jgi:uncharacterized metal-binding protein YceD (DUF177 family)
MSIICNIKQLESQSLSFKGLITAKELDLENIDICVHLNTPVEHNFIAKKASNTIRLLGRLRFELDCECVHCLKPFKIVMDWADWECIVPLQGEMLSPIINDCVDLTPYVREDILLAFPQHPLCEPGCNKLPFEEGKDPRADLEKKALDSVWDQLDKLNL